MARHLFPGDVVWGPDGNVAANFPFTWWDDPVAGAQYTDITAPDGVSVVPLVTDAQGLRPVLRGPDEVKIMYCDTGAGVRFPVEGTDEVKYVLEQFRALQAEVAAIVTTSGGVTDHGQLSGLTNDDHGQYLNASRGDSRYYTKAQVDDKDATASTATSTADRDRRNHTFTQSITTVEGLTARVLPAGGGTGQVLAKTSSTDYAVAWANQTAVSYASLPAGTTLTVQKTTTWPARPTSRTDIIVQWKGADPSPAVVASGTGGMLDNVDIRLITA